MKGIPHEFTNMAKLRDNTNQSSSGSEYIIQRSQANIRCLCLCVSVCVRMCVSDVCACVRIHEGYVTCYVYPGSNICFELCNNYCTCAVEAYKCVSELSVRKTGSNINCIVRCT